MVKVEMIDLVVKRTGYQRKVIDRIIRVLIDVIIEALQAGEQVSLHRLGTLHTSITPAYQHRHPSTGELFEMKPMRKLFLRPSPMLKKNLSIDKGVSGK